LRASLFLRSSDNEARPEVKTCALGQWPCDRVQTSGVRQNRRQPSQSQPQTHLMVASRSRRSHMARLAQCARLSPGRRPERCRDDAAGSWFHCPTGRPASLVLRGEVQNLLRPHRVSGSLNPFPLSDQGEGLVELAFCPLNFASLGCPDQLSGQHDELVNSVASEVP